MENQGIVISRSRLLEAAREAPAHPGVYLMKGSNDEILYIGKAKNLRNRLVSYFQGDCHDIPRIELMVCRVVHFDQILTETEVEALILEATLIKKHKPRFNIRLKDDKAYPYLKIQVNEAFPRIEWTRRVLKDGARYFGPFPSAYSARQVMELFNELFSLRDCSDNTFRHRSRPCILHQMGRCTAPCVGKIAAEDYRATINEVVDLLQGRGTHRLIAELRDKMEEAAAADEFEVAAWYRDQMRSLELVTAIQIADEAGSGRNRDVVGLARGAGEAHGAVLQIRAGRFVAVRHFGLSSAALQGDMPEAELLREFLSQYYVLTDPVVDPEAPVDLAAGRVNVARASEVLVPVVPDGDELSKALGLEVRTAESDADRQLVSVARLNAEHALEQATRRTAGHGARALEEVQEKLGLPRLPARIECYDISNTQGEEAVASRVVFVDGAPDKNLYRRYKIRTVEGQNDFAMMREVLGRRFEARPGKPGRDTGMPDLVVVDGGKGQLSQATAILEELGVQGVAVVGLAKARTESDFQSSEVKSSRERIFIPGRKNPVALLPHTEAYKLLTHVRDEAHRFAISYHRLLRGKKSMAHE